MFIDQIKLKLIAGKGGNGVVAWTREKFIPKGGPCGGNGGKGGSIILQSTHHLYALDKYRHAQIFKAQDGAQGGGNGRQGRNGEDLVLLVPCGTLVKDVKTGQLLFDFTKPGEELVVCTGGNGGRGNESFKTPTHQAPHTFTHGKEGSTIEVDLELKLIADVGFVGMPNAGKSTLLSQLTTCKVKIGDYPFTTLVPNLSFIEYEDYSRVYLADIPGIIEGASENRGLGLEFLKHIERSSVIVFVIDAAGFEGRHPIDDFKLLRLELERHNAKLLEKPFLIALNKVDEESAQPLIEEFYETFPDFKSQCLEISAKHGQGMHELKQMMKDLAQVVVKRYH
jgi:GTP-binding protein